MSDLKPITMNFPDTPAMRDALARLARELHGLRWEGNEFATIEREITRAVMIRPEPTDPPAYDGGGDQP